MLKTRFLPIIIAVYMFSCSEKNHPTITKECIERDIMVLAADSMEGRAPLSAGEEKTLKYLKNRMSAIGLEPAFHGSFLQEVPLVEVKSSLPEKVVFSKGHKNIELKTWEEVALWSPLLKDKITLKQSDLVFAGYGINAPELGWNDFEDIDVRGKTIVVLVNDPGFHTEDSTLFNGKAMTYYGRWTYKFEEANRQGAAGCIIVHEDAAAGYPWSVVNGRANRTEFYLNNNALREQTCQINGWITQDAAIDLFNFSGMNYEEMKQKASLANFQPIGMSLKYSVSLQNSWKKSLSNNVGGIIRGSERPDEAIVYTAHWDHLGVGEPINGDSIYNGASDNAAAVAWMLAIAEAFVAEKTAPERSILFLSPTAEEAGMLGSQHYVNNPIFEHSKTAACFNSDVIMFLGKFKDVTVTGLGHSELDRFLEEEAAKQDRYICNDPNPENGMFYRSDQLPFLKAGIPSLFAKGYSHQVDLGREKTLEAVEDYWQNTYHKPSDIYDPEIHSLEGLVEDAILFFELGKRLANTSYLPRWIRSSEFYKER